MNKHGAVRQDVLSNTIEVWGNIRSLVNGKVTNAVWDTFDAMDEAHEAVSEYVRVELVGK